MAASRDARQASGARVSGVTPGVSAPTGVTLEFPAERRFMPLARLAVADAAARAGMTLRETDDLAVATGEACSALMRRAPAASILRVTVFDRLGRIEVEAGIDNGVAPVRVSSHATGTMFRKRLG